MAATRAREDASQPVDAARRFGGVARLYGDAALPALARAHVCVIGIGGVGSWTAEALARSGVGQLTLIDLDHVAESNLNRQVHALGSTLGVAKVEAMRARIADIWPDCVVRMVDDFVTEDNVEQLVPAGALVVDAIDAPRAKAALIACLRRRGQPMVVCGGAGGRTDPLRLRRDDLSRTKATRCWHRCARDCAATTVFRATRPGASASRRSTRTSNPAGQRARRPAKRTLAAARRWAARATDRWSP